MKKIAFFFLFLAIAHLGFAQGEKTDTQLPEYISKGTIPEFKIFTMPDSVAFTNRDLKKDKPLILMIFSPNCGHCQHETQLIEKNIDRFKDAQILMVTWLPYSTLEPFAASYGTKNYEQITLGYDPKDFLYGYYDVHKYPTLVVYDKKGNYVNRFDGSFEISEVWEALNND